MTPTKRDEQPPKPERWLVLPDIHVPFHDPYSMAPVLEYAKTQLLAGCVLIGDLGDFESISHWTRSLIRKVEGKRLIKNYDAMNRILDWIEESVRNINRSAEIKYIEGNHENWVEQYIDVHPEMEGLMEIPLNLHLAERQIDWIPFWTDKNQQVHVGKATFVHGEYTSKYHAAKMVDVYGTNVYYGHTHDVMEFPKTNKGDGHTFVGKSLGCLNRYDLEYKRGKADNWQQAFATFDFFPNGNYTEQTYRIFDHTFSLGRRDIWNGYKMGALARRYEYAI